ncbi:MAG: hypothetical protein P4L49_11960 [Desulfosporosinus sp.]|nr:hypothetical protein [Desulfosporosinus sp.]
MAGNQPGNLSGNPINMGIRIFAPISSVAGSATLYFNQPFIIGSVLASSAILIASELFLFIAQRLFCLESIPVLDVQNGQTIQMPLTELQEFLRCMANGSAPSPNLKSVTDKTNTVVSTTGEFDGTSGLQGLRGFPTPELPEAPLIVALYVTADYSSIANTPYITLTVPILTFPGIRGALPMLILGLLAAIFVRAVVPPESTGSKPLSQPKATMNNPLTFTPNDLLQLLNRFGKHFGSK